MTLKINGVHSREQQRDSVILILKAGHAGHAGLSDLAGHLTIDS